MATASELYLSPEQRSLLLAALSSNSPANGSTSNHNRTNSQHRSMSNDSYIQDSNDAFKADTNSFISADFFNSSEINALDYSGDFTLDDSFKYEFNDDDVSPPADHDKRKHDSDSDSDDDSHETDAKRRGRSIFDKSRVSPNTKEENYVSSSLPHATQS